MNLGIADGNAAARAIALGETDGYTEARHAIGARVMAASEAGRKAITSNNLVIQLATTAVTLLATQLPLVGRKFMRNLTRL
jgi:2-polyprenyl-6-methoxyphenol hydroxylase-like FAD-dependent oxidoreductase